MTWHLMARIYFDSSVRYCLASESACMRRQQQSWSVLFCSPVKLNLLWWKCNRVEVQRDSQIQWNWNWMGIWIEGFWRRQLEIETCNLITFWMASLAGLSCRSLAHSKALSKCSTPKLWFPSLTAQETGKLTFIQGEKTTNIWCGRDFSLFHL